MRLQQHRLFVQSVVVSQNYVRFMRWDTVGVVVSEPIDLKKDLLSVLQVFSYMGQMTDVELGWDPTVQAASATDATLWKDAFDKVNKRLSDHYKEVFSSENCRYKITVNGDDLRTAKERWDTREGPVPMIQPQAREFLIGTPSTSHRSPTGRATKGFLAFDLQEKKFVFLKDSWRPDYSAVEGLTVVPSDPEIVILADLHEAQVIPEHIPDVVCGGDLSLLAGASSAQRTATDQFLRGYTPRLHTRLVLQQIGLPLASYSGSNELVNVMYDALIGMFFPNLPRKNQVYV